MLKKVKNKMEKNNLYTIDKDFCPQKDNILIQGQCGGCEYYNGFELYEGQRCIKCAYYSSKNDILPSPYLDFR